MAGRRRLVENLAAQAMQRRISLPPGTVQKVVVDVQSQQLFAKDAIQLANEISSRSGRSIEPENIRFKR